MTNQRSRIEETIFAKLEVRREVLSSIRKRIERCSQDCARLRMVSTNLESTRAEQQDGECDQVHRQVENEKLQLKSDVTSYIRDTNQFLCSGYEFVIAISLHHT